MIPNSKLWSFGVQTLCPVFEKPCHHKTFYVWLPEKATSLLAIGV